MPVDRSYIAGFALRDANAYLALTALANFADALESAAGVRVGAGGGAAQTQAAAPAVASWTIVAAQGHYIVQISNPDSAGATPVQHQVRSGLDQRFDAHSAVTSYTLGLGQTSLDVVDPNLTKFWQLRSRLAGSDWNPWQTYATAAGVVALNAGALRTS